MGKEQVYINVYESEDGNQIYFVGKYVNENSFNLPADVCSLDAFEGFFNEFLEEHAKEIKIVRDYREGEE